MKTRIIILAGVVLLLALFAGNTEASRNGYKVGDNVSDFNLSGVDGKQVSLSSYRGAKGFIVVFTCNTCPYAKAYESRIIELHNKYAPKGYHVVAINSNDVNKKPEDSMDEMKKLAQQKNYPFAYLRDDTQEVAQAFGATKTPHVYVIRKNDSAGKMTVEFIGAIDNSPLEAADASEYYVENAVDALLNNEQPSVTEVRAVGCTIKWKG